MKYFVECTYVFDHPSTRTGIQRVVRNVINNLDDATPDCEAIPIVFKEGKPYKVNQLSPDRIGEALSQFRLKLSHGRHLHWHLHHKLHHSKLLSRSSKIKFILFNLFRFLSLWALIPIAAIEAFFRLKGGERIEPIEIGQNDVLILLDSSWHYGFFGDVEKLRENGVKVIGVVYDLIPITHSQFCVSGLIASFKKWFSWLLVNTDGIMCISQSVANDVRDALKDQQSTKQKPWVDYFYLGTELDLINRDNASVSPIVERIFQSEGATYLSVSTIEPRKNYAYTLDAFDTLWQQGEDVKLCLVGAIGWHSSDLIERIKTHPEYQKRLFLLSGLSDDDLDYCYKHAARLIFASHAEGFGLPLVEALDRGLPVLASDIPVFREIGQEHVSYFDLRDPDSLAQFITYGDKLDPASLSNWSWITWQESTAQLLSNVRQHLEPSDNAPKEARS